MREAYAAASRATGVNWSGRSYNRGNWGSADPINRALSAANSCLYGVCCAAIVSSGYSPGLGFIHTGKQLSFAYDIADLYKAETTIPAAFAATAAGTNELERRVRLECRDMFQRTRLLGRVVDDIGRALTVPGVGGSDDPNHDVDEDGALPGGFWDPQEGTVDGGVNYGDVTTDEPEGEPRQWWGLCWNGRRRLCGAS